MSSETEKQVKVSHRKDSSPITFASILKEILEFKGWEVIFKMLLYAFLCWGAYSLYLVYLFHHDARYANVAKFSIHDFKVTIFPTLFFFFYKRLCLKLFYGYMRRTLNPEKFHSEEEMDLRAHKNSIWLSAIIYYTFTSLMSYFLFKDTWFFPTILGGSKECSAIYDYTPESPHIPYAQLFYQVQFGWHFHTLIDHVVYKWREPKFWEMFLHHCVAVFLIFFSYLSNQIAVGILVLTTHDPCDIGLYGTRLYNDRKYRSNVKLGLFYAYFMLSWMFLRLFVFPKCIVGQGFYELPRIDGEEPMRNVYLYLLVMLSALVLLHFYWFLTVFKIAVNIVSNRADSNDYDTSKISKQEEALELQKNK